MNDLFATGFSGWPKMASMKAFSPTMTGICSWVIEKPGLI